MFYSTIRCNKIMLMLAAFTMLAAFSSPAQVKYTVRGQVSLEDKPVGPYDGVKIRFVNLTNNLPVDSTTSGVDGSYTIMVPPGYYLVEWSKDNYVPEELGGLALSKDTTLAAKTMIPGQIMYISGSVSGQWTRNYVYYVTGNITVPSGQVLSIDPGVRVKFYKGTSMTCNGTLIAEGTPSQHIIFTSREPSPLPGDWGNVTLYAQNNTLRYIDYDWATNGIVASNATGSIFENIRIWGTLSLTANGIYINSGTSLTISHNRIAVAGPRGIYAYNPTNSNIIGNTLDGSFSDAAIYAPGADNSKIDSNTIAGKPVYGIWADYSDNTSISNNQMEVGTGGIIVNKSTTNGGSNLTINKNVITNCSSTGINFSGCINSVVNYNRVIFGSTAGYTTYGIVNMSSNQNAVVNYNYLSIGYSSNYGLVAHNSTIIGDTVIFTSNSYDAYAIYGNSSIIKNNYISTANYSGWPDPGSYSQSSIKSTGTSVSRSIIDSNTVLLNSNANGIRASYASITNNTIKSNSAGWALITNGNCSLVNNNVTDVSNGIYANSSPSNTITGNRIIVQNQGVYAVNNSSVTAKYNLFKTQSGRGIHIENQSGQEFTNNTIISNGGDYGVWISNNCNPIVKNNIIQGFQKGIYAQNTIQNFNLKYNDFWNVGGNLFEGTALPPLVGQFVDKNSNGYSSDIYGNINQDPLFVLPNANNFSLKAASALINSGDPSLKDPDSTVSDIGAYPYYIYVAIQHTPLTSTINTTAPYTVTATVVSPLGYPVSASLFYRVSGIAFSQVPMTNTTGNTFVGEIPPQPLGTKIDYYICGQEGVNSVNNPFNAPAQFYTFYVTLVQTMSNLSGGSTTSGAVKLQWTKPTLTQGNLLNFSVYRSTTPGDASPVLLTRADTTTMTFTDTDVKEGRTYYYRVGGTIARPADTISTIFSNEASVMSDKAGVVWAHGIVKLEDAAQYDSVMVEFERTSPSPLTRDTVYTDASGFYEFVASAGIYNINIRRYGWQPSQIPNQILTANKQFDTLTMKKGYAVYVSGNVKGNWTNNNAYYVTGTLTVSAGDTLSIQPGTQVRFLDYYSMTVNGLLLANGDSLHHIEFTSGKPVPQRGDWGSIILNGPRNVIRWVDYSFANDGFNGANASGTMIANSSITNLALEGRGIYLSNSRELMLTNNVITLQNGIGIFASNSGKSTISTNTIGTASNIAGIQADNSDTTTIANNTVSGKPAKGIWAQSADRTTISGNVLDVSQYGIDAQSGSWLNIFQNMISNFNYKGIVFNYTTNSILLKNRLVSALISSSESRGIENSAVTQGSQLVSNYIELKCNGGVWNVWGIYGYDSYISNDTVKISTNDYYYQPRGIRADNSIIAKNLIDVTAPYGTYYGISIESYGGISKKSVIKNNVLINGVCTKGVWASYADIDSNIIQGNNNSDWSICGGSENTITNNTIDNMYYGIKADGASNNIIANNSIKTLDKAVYLSNSNAVVKNNLIKSQWGRGIDCINTSGKEISGNTIVGAGSGSNDYGIFISNLSSPQVFNNIIKGFQTGLRAESQVPLVAYNDLWNVSTKFSGTGLPAIIGEVTTVNVNGTPSDVYSNIFQNPLFVNDSAANYNLSAWSPCINAGRSDIMDLDGTVSDLGACSYNFGYTPQNVKVDSTGDGFVSLSWTIPQTDSLTSFTPYKKLKTESAWTALPPVSGHSVTFTNLANNTSYDFAVSANYNVLESNKSAVVASVPGIAKMVVAPSSIVLQQKLNDTTAFFYTVYNGGTKDLQIQIGPYTRTVNSSASLTVADTLIAHTNGITQIPIIINSTGAPVMSDTVSVLQIVGPYATIKPVRFKPVDTTSAVFVALVQSGMVDGVSFKTGTEVGLFDGDTCVGAAAFNGVMPMIVKAYGKVGATHGYTGGHQLAIKVWDFSQSRYAIMTPTVSLGDLAFSTGGFVSLSLNGSIYQTVASSLARNKFNLVSTYLMPQNVSASSVFSTISGLKIVYQDNGSAYIPAYGVNTIGTMDVTRGYHVFTSDSNQILNVKGMMIDPTAFPVTLQPKKFNSISYLLEKPQDVAATFNGVRDSIEIIQDDQGGAWIPKFNINSLGSLKPLKGYQVYTNTTKTINFIYRPVPAGLSKMAAAEKIDPTYFSFTNTGMPYSIVITNAMIDGMPLASGDEIAAYDGDVCVGAAVWQEGGSHLLTAWKQSEEYHMSGYREGGPITFRVYKKSVNKAAAVTAAFENPEESVFGRAAYSVANINARPNIAPPEVFALNQNYPNPFNPSTIISFDVPKTSLVSITIYNTIGQEVARLVDNVAHEPGRYRVEWRGKNDAGQSVSTGVYLFRMKAGEFTSVRKMIMLK